ncbi:sterol desaturase family protein [Pikeienuella sp. HZG-20]|uniref:sterol desaturase family protein n=1 Tax=Paludibacillus litoralis TaxID=3133267 RepID=UPI0030EDE5A9
MLAFAVHFLALTVVIWVINTALYFLGGWAILAYAARRSERKIQANADGAHRAREEIMESLRSIAATSACMALAITLSVFGHTLWAPMTGWLGVIAGAAILIVGYDLYFYWAHRLLHTKPLIRYHRWHHQSRAPTVWSSDSQSLVETLMLQSFMIWAAVLLPIPPLAIVLHRLYDHFNGQLGHCGYEFFADRGTRFPSPMVCVTYHDQHHELYRWNYGNFTSIWDRLHGTMHPDYDRLVAERERKTAKAE